MGRWHVEMGLNAYHFRRPCTEEEIGLLPAKESFPIFGAP